MSANPNPNELPTTPLEVARFFLDKGIRSVVVPYGEKDPHTDHWQDTLHDEDALERLFSRRTNIGALLGKHSDNLLDADLDAMEAVRAAHFFLPETGMMWGRSRKPRSHWLYRMASSDGVRYREFNDPTPKDDLARRGLKARLLELRFTGRQSLAPGSVNTADGCIDPVRFEADATGDLTSPDFTHLVAQAERLAAVALVARYWRDGERHDSALPLGGLLWHGGLPIDDALYIMEAVCAAAHDEQLDDRLRCVRDTYRNGEAGHPISGGPTLAEECFGAAIVRRLRTWLHLKAKKDRGMLGPDGLPLESDGDADRFAARWGGEVLYCAAEGCWYRYNGIFWERDRTEHILELAKTVLREFRVLVGSKAAEPNVYGVGGVASYDDCAKYAVRMGSESRITAMLHLALSIPELAVTPEQFDADPLMFNLLDCTLDLNVKTGEVSSHLHRSTDLLRRVAVGHYRPDATHPLLEQAYSRFHPEEDHRAFLEDFSGYCLTGLPKRHGLQLLGPHDTGKSTFLTMLERTWGTYGGSLADTNLAKNQHKGGDIARPDLLRVKDMRIVTVKEVDPGTQFDVALFKIIHSGGDTVAIRNFFDKAGGDDHVFHCSIWMSGNKEYGLPPGESAAYARVEVLECDHVIPEESRDTAEELATTDPTVVGDAVVAGAVRGFRRVYGEQHGLLRPPKSAELAKQELRARRDPFSDVIDRIFTITHDPNDAVQKAQAWAVVKNQIQLSGEVIFKPRALQKAFEDALEWRVGKPTHSDKRWGGTVDYWQGIRWSEYARERYADLRLPDWGQP